MDLPELRNQIREAFPAEPFHGLVTLCDCEECTHMRNELGAKRWDEISTKFLDFTCSPTLLTVDAKRAFLPAYLLRALDDLNVRAVVVEFTVYSISPGDSDWDGESLEEFRGEDDVACLREFAGGMSAEQIQAVRAFLLYVRENAGSGEWFAPFIDSGLEKVWC
jgi:hypothetical protein